MRLIRGLTTGLASLALLPAIGQAQAGRLFNNSWFWGVNGGVMTYWTTNVSHAQAPTIGAEWMITQKHTALYIGVDQSFFKTTNVGFTNVGFQYKDSTFTGGTNVGYGATASVHNSRHINVALLGAPGSGPIRPYAGVGISVNFVQNSAITSAPPSSSGLPGTNPAYWSPNAFGNVYLDQQADWVSPIIMAGLQAQVSRVSIYGQAKMMTTSNQHLFTDGAFFILQAGIRFNVSSVLTGN
jgi:hypothetical protein